MAKQPKGSYRNPPESTRFKPGQSGNPNGRPKGSKNLKTVVDKELRKRVTVNENGKPRQVPKLELIIQRLVHDAIKGQHRAADLLLRLLREFGAGEAEVDAATGEVVIPDRDTLRRIKDRLDRFVDESDE